MAATGRDEQKAALAVGHSILVIAWHLLRNNTDYTDLGADWFARRIDNNTRRRDHLIHELQTMGYCVTGTVSSDGQTSLLSSSQVPEHRVCHDLVIITGDTLGH